jgi:dolichol-phosphate mannosyltransferase
MNEIFLIVIPAYNEESGINKTIETIFSFLNSNDFSDVRILVVNDGSTDCTRDKLLKLSSKYSEKLIFLEHEINRGYGAANSTAISWAIKNNITYSLFMDADLTQDPIYIKHFYEYILLGYDVIKATRYSKGGSTLGVPFKRWIISYLGNKMAKILFQKGINDYTNGFRAIKNKELEGLVPNERGFAYIMEEMQYLGKKKHLRWNEVPYLLTVRNSDYPASSFVYNPKIIWKYFKHLF